MRALTLTACLVIVLGITVGTALARPSEPTLKLPLAPAEIGVSQYSLRIDGIPGVTLWPRGTDWITILNRRPRLVEPTILGGRITPGSLTFLKPADGASVKLTQHFGDVVRYPWAKLQLVRKGKVVWAAEFTDVWVSDLLLLGWTGTEGAAMEQVTLNFVKVQVTCAED